MPIMDGYEATKQLRKLEDSFEIPPNSRSYVIGLTAHSTDVYKVKCFDFGMDDFSKLKSTNIYSD